MTEKIFDSPITDKICNVAQSEEFVNLNPKIQEKVIDSLTRNDSTGQEGGFMGKFLGTKKENAAMNIALIICAILVIIGVISQVGGKDYWEVIIPAVTTALGYIFGKSDK